MDELTRIHTLTEAIHERCRAAGLPLSTVRFADGIPTVVPVDATHQAQADAIAADVANNETAEHVSRRQAATLLSRPDINTLVNAIIHELYPLVDRLAKKAGEPIRTEKHFKEAVAARIAAGDVSDPA